jgi:hypothetical protein
MPSPVQKSDLLERLLSAATGDGVQSRSTSGDTIAGEQTVIGSKWFLGGRKVNYKFSCRLDETAHEVKFREMSSESSWGVPPPTLTVEKTSQRGAQVSQSRTDKSVGGGGSLEYGRLRAAIERAVQDAGWQFTLEAGKTP